ncbi:MAG: hypothetical protein ACC707_13975 [Thiohalomonadales bacterium]
MGLFQKKGASKLFSSSFAIGTAESGNAESVVDVNEQIDEQDKTADDVLKEDIAEGDFVAIEKSTESAPGSKALSISQVVQLVRSLPQQGTDEELHAVLRTLELFDVDVRHVLDDSYRKQTVTTERIETLLSEISTLDEEIDKRAKEIQMLEVGITEMSRVNQCLELMLKLDKALLEAEQDQHLIENLSMDDVDEKAPTDSSEDDLQADADKKSESKSVTGESKSENSLKKTARERLDDYVKNGQTQTLDGLVIDLDSPPKRLKISKKPKVSKQKNKKTVEQES